MSKLSFSKLLTAYTEVWEHMHRWGRIIRSANFIDIVRLLHIILMGYISSEVVNLSYIQEEFESKYGLEGNVADSLEVAIRENLVIKKGGVYELTLDGRLFLFIIADMLIEIASFYEIPPTQREIGHVVRLLSMIRVYEGEGLISENIGLLITALSNVRKSIKFIEGDNSEDLYEKLIEEYSFIKNLASKFSYDTDFTKALQTLASLIDTEITFIKEHLQEIKRLRKKSFLLLHMSSDDIKKIRDVLLSNADKYFNFVLFPVSNNVVPVGYIRQFLGVKDKEVDVTEDVYDHTVKEETVLIPSSDELFHVLWTYYNIHDELPDMGSDRWWLDKLSLYKEQYKVYKGDKGYIRALKSRKAMALSMFLTNGVTDESMKESILKKGKAYFERGYNDIAKGGMV